jgi:glycyl-tRNA synthetase beta chain
MTSRSGPVFLLEIGTEEIPARMIEGALRDLAQGLFSELGAARLLPDSGFSLAGNLETFGTPRRLAVRVRDLRARQPDVLQEITGPPVGAAYDATGRPTRASEGFARAQGVAVSALERIRTPKGECVGVRRKASGLPAEEVLALKVPPVVAALAFPKTMRWGTGEHRFVRPIHWVVALLDRRVVDMTLCGVRSGPRTRGHRLAGAGWITLADPSVYVEVLRDHLVVAPIEARRSAIQAQLQHASTAAGGRIAAPPGAPAGTEGDAELLQELTQSVECPLVITGEFDVAFLDLPREILVTALRHHQKSFALEDRQGGLQNRFLAIADTRDDPKGAIRRGNEWVLRARLADARFFWDEDRKAALGAHAATLDRITFHEKLGSYARKVDRMIALAGTILPAFERSGQPVDGGAAREALRLCKADLTTQMVKEFPELQGIVGGLYARADGAPESTAAAIYDHYLPRGAEDPLPRTPEAALVSLADRLDTQAGIFLLGIVPTGSRDPYGLRRSVLGTCRILIEMKIHLSLRDLIERALAGYRDPSIEGTVVAEDARAALLEFYRGRLEHLGQAISPRPDTVRAALAAAMDDPYDVRLRLEALDVLRREPGFLTLALAHKRIKNILKDRKVGPSDGALLQDDAERALERALRQAMPLIETAQARADHLAALRAIERLGPHLDRFFAEVLVMAEDPRLRDNRLGLLREIGGLLLRVADFSEMAVDAEAEA